LPRRTNTFTGADVPFLALLLVMLISQSALAQGVRTVEMGGVTVLQWNVADYAAGHHDNSADPGEGGNVVISGHDDYRGEVFRGLHDAKIGDDVFVDTPAGTFHYIIREIYLRKEKGEPLSTRLDIGVWMGPMPEERLTLITCWPYGVDDHRMIIVAKPAQDDVGQFSP